MNVLFCDNDLKSFLNFRGYIAKYFHEKGYNVCVAIPEKTYTYKIKKWVPYFLKVYPVKLNQNSSNPLSDIKYFIQIFRLFRNISPDVIFLYTIKPNIYGSIASKLLNIPVVAMVAGLGYIFSSNGLRNILGRKLYKFGLRKANRVIVLNRSIYDTIKNNGFAEKKNIILFENGEGIDLNQFKYLSDDYENVRFLMVARVLYDKGYTEYIEAAKLVKQKYPNIKIELLGPLAENSPMGVPRAIVEQDHNSGVINYLGETDDVSKYIGQKGVVVVVVSSYHEGFNRSLMEACAMGRICITSDVSGCKELIDNNHNGLLVPPKNPQALADAMISLIEETPISRHRMSINSHDKAMLMFDVKYVYMKYDMILSELGV